jgi:regulator of vacuolar morphogenesis
MLQQRRTGLETYLRAIVSSQDPTWRESDEFRAFIELPKDHGSASALLGRSAGEGAATARRSAQQKYVPGSYTADSPRSVSTSDGAGRSGLTTRVLGTVPVRESQETRTLDDRGLMSGHQEQMDAQDRQLEGLAAILRRQKAMGLAINQELTEQTDLLDDLDSHVDKTQSKMRSAEKQMDRL